MSFRKIRLEKKLTLQEVSKKTQINIASLHRYETLKRFPNLKTMKVLKDFYNLKDDEIANLYLTYWSRGE